MNIPINIGTLRFKILKIFSFVFCLPNCGDVSVVVFIPMLFVDNLPVSPFKKGGILSLVYHFMIAVSSFISKEIHCLKTTDHKAA